MSPQNLFRRLLQLIVALFLLAQLFVSSKWIQENIALISEAPQRTNDEKMQLKLGAYYELVQFVQKETPANATLLFDSPSHSNLDLYFLYPRKIIYDSDLTTRMQSVDYIVMTGESPIPDIQGEKKMLDAKRGLIKLRR